MTKSIIIFTDGASKGNPGPGACGVVIVLPEGKVVELGNFEAKTTNNRMELFGAILALEKVINRDENVNIFTDSKYLINGITNWVYTWQKNNWKTKEKKDVLNKDLWKNLVALVSKILPKKISWNYVGGHTGIAGNERCDEIASQLALGKKVDLYNGSLTDYKINILDFDFQTNPSFKKLVTNSNKKNQKAYLYLSLIKGVLYQDKTWAECEKRVKGQKGVKYKKAISEDNKKEILKEWGLNE